MDNCLFCKIIAGEIPSAKVYEDDKLLAFKDINPQAPVHILIIPKEHFDSVNALDETSAPIVGDIMLLAKRLADEFHLEAGYRLITNIGENGGQTVKHLHFHLIGGVKLAEKMC
ncbi:MAG: histidine triad nucleotide-binding protein [Ruminiclostridium sp.]|nr:histidine triad nucleotide-binding protein [Ruminiclostridium sp.]